MARSHRLDGAITIAGAVATLPAPSAVTDGAAVTSWRQGGYSDRITEIAITAEVAVTLTDAWLCGWNGTTWLHIAQLNGGNAIDLAGTLGWAEKFTDVGTFTRLAVESTKTAGEVTVIGTQIEVL